MMNPDSPMRKWLFIAGGILCLLAAYGLVSTFKGRFPSDPPSVHTSRSRPEPAAAKDEFADDESVKDEKQDKADKKSGKCMIYITGAVARPGVYEVPPGSRVNDAVLAAGGFTSKADPEAVNLAARIEDEEHIIVPSRGAPPVAQNVGAAQGAAKTPSPPANSPTQPNSAKADKAGKADKKSQITGRIDINRASAAELMSLPGIGPKLSQMIVDYRDANGAYTTPEDIKKVKGIGQKRFEAIRDLITTGR